jgi:two-component system, NtrC family, sensor kinase
VTDRRRELERFRLVVETTSHAIVISDLQRRVIYANPAAHALFGVIGGDLSGRPVDDLLPPESRGEVARRHARATAGEPQRYETVVLGAGGARRIVAVSNAPLREGGAVTGSVASLLDITDERAARDAMAESEARYARLVDTASDAIFSVDREGRFTSANRSVEIAIGKTEDKLLGTPFWDTLDPEALAVAERLFADMLNGKRGRAELAYAMPGGERRIGSITTAPIIEEGEVLGAVGIMRDITEERRLAEQLLQREKLAAIGQLVSGVAHELNNPLAGIMAFAQLLHATAAMNAEQRDSLETIHREAKRAAKIVSNLLFFARQRSPERGATDLNQVLLDTLEMRSYVLRTQQVEVITDLDVTLPLTWADAFQLQQVALNLITNAEQALATHRGPKSITLASRWLDGRLAMVVSDTGPGIAPDQIDQLFNPFYTTKPVGEGTGLGLSISDGIVRQHGGEIRVNSRAGAGATFTVLLPHVAVPVDSAPAATPVVERSSEARAFLLVDDEPSIRTALAIFLRRCGHTVQTAESGEEALALLGRRRYDGIFLDLRMPDLSGAELFAQLRSRDPDQAERVVFTTGDVDADGTRDFLLHCGRPFVPKPFALGTVTEMLERVGRDARQR